LVKWKGSFAKALRYPKDFRILFLKENGMDSVGSVHHGPRTVAWRRLAGVQLAERYGSSSLATKVLGATGETGDPHQGQKMSSQWLIWADDDEDKRW
jgi:hypothetical protein